MLFATSIIFFLDFVRNFILIDSQHSNLSSPTVIDFDNFEFLQKNYKKDNFILIKLHICMLAFHAL